MICQCAPSKKLVSWCSEVVANQGMTFQSQSMSGYVRLICNLCVTARLKVHSRGVVRCRARHGFAEGFRCLGGGTLVTFDKVPR